MELKEVKERIKKIKIWMNKEIGEDMSGVELDEERMKFESYMLFCGYIMLLLMVVIALTLLSAILV